MVRAREVRGWIGLSAVMLVAGCVPATSAADQPPLLLADGVTREAPSADAPTAATVEGLTRFGYDLYRIVASPDRNVVLSPLCVGYAFALARAGAKGETAAQIDRVFGFPGDGVHDALNSLNRQVVTAEGPPGPRPQRTPGVTLPPTVSIANGLFVQRDFQVGAPFLRTLAAKYGAGVRTVDFGAGDEAKRTIDEWARVQTADRIKRVFDSLDPTTKLVLANAVYFKADWTHPFTSSSDNETFTRADGTTVRTTLMHRIDQLRYAAGPSWQAVELPYAQSEFAMWILVPTGAAGPDGLLSPPTLANVADNLGPTLVEVFLPRWDFETRPALVPALKQLGLTAPFGPADFSGIATGLYIADAMHAANITVDETGTEAAAIAAVVMELSKPAPPELVIRADRPFAFAIMHLPTRTPLFIGRVVDPTAT